jgi:hypothetical protein
MECCRLYYLYWLWEEKATCFTHRVKVREKPQHMWWSDLEKRLSGAFNSYVKGEGHCVFGFHENQDVD